MVLMYGKPDPLIFDFDWINIGITFNLNSLKEKYQKMPLLIPPNNLGVTYDKAFDINYASYIMNNDAVFVEFFQIIYNLYIGKNVYIMVDTGYDWAENVVESLLKLIQQRYGINAVEINVQEDYEFALQYGNSEIDSRYGIMNLDMDKERFTLLVEQFRINFNQLPYNLEGFIAYE